MPGGYGRMRLVEDFTSGIAQTLTDATEYRWGDFRLAAISGDVAMDIVVDEGNGVATFSGAAQAADGVAIFALPFIPSRNGTLIWEARWKVSAVTDYRAFFGFAQTVALAEPVNPFTLSGTTLTANNSGNCFGIYYDTQATTDDWRALASVTGTANTTAIDGVTSVAYGSLGTRLNTTIVLDSWMYARCEIDPDGKARMYFSDVSTDPNNTGPRLVSMLPAGVISASAALHPMLLLAEQSTGDPLHHVDFVAIDYNRDWRFATP